MRGYYVEVLGMTEIPKPPVLAARGGCWFRAGAVHLHLGIEKDFPAREEGPPGLHVTGVEFAARPAGPRGRGHLGRQPPRPPPLLLRGPRRQPTGVPGATGSVEPFGSWERLGSLEPFRVRGAARIHGTAPVLGLAMPDQTRLRLQTVQAVPGQVHQMGRHLRLAGLATSGRH